MLKFYSLTSALSNVWCDHPVESSPEKDCYVVGDCY